MSKRTSIIRNDFAGLLPQNLGQPYIMNTLKGEIVCVAFYDATRHEIEGVGAIEGNEFRLCKYKASGFSHSRLLAGVVGIRIEPPAFVFCALTDQGTKAKDLFPYKRVVFDMLAEAASSQIDLR